MPIARGLYHILVWHASDLQGLVAISAWTRIPFKTKRMDGLSRARSHSRLAAMTGAALTETAKQGAPNYPKKTDPSQPFLSRGMSAQAEEAVGRCRIAARPSLTQGGTLRS